MTSELAPVDSHTVSKVRRAEHVKLWLIAFFPVRHESAAFAASSCLTAGKNVRKPNFIRSSPLPPEICILGTAHAAACG